MNALDYAYLIPLLPLTGAVIIGLAGGRVLKGASHIIAILALLGSAIIALGIVREFQGGQVAGGMLDRNFFNWISAGHLQISVGIFIDPLTAIYLAFVTVISLLIFIFASGYMKGDYGYFRFFAYLCLFVFAMTMLVMGNNFVLLYLGWEGVGVASYLLIGYYYPRPSAVAAAKKAFITNRIGDFGFAIGIFVIFITFGALDYQTVFAKLADHAFVLQHEWAISVIPFLLMVGAFGKSAQFPLHVWLPDAMEGPTPVSALIHAATMVTAGIYMIARCQPIFALNEAAMAVVAIVGGFTSLLAASIALCQYDLKKIWAYSTVSQLGYMFMALGMAASTAAVFHVFTHAFFKALLFLSAGAVMHAMGGELDIRKMSGVRKVMPITAFTMLMGCLALSGVPGLAGFFSKDEILYKTFNSHIALGGVHLGPILGTVGLLVALLTAYYTFRLFFRVFMGPKQLPSTAGHHEPSPFALADDHGHGTHDAHESNAHDHGHEAHASHGPNDGPASMWIPLLCLSVGAIGVGYLGVFGGQHGHGGWFHDFLAPVLQPVVHGSETETVVHKDLVSHGAMGIISSILAVIGIGIAAYFHLWNRAAATGLAQKLQPIVTFLENKWFIDELYDAIIKKPLWLLGQMLFLFDRLVIDGLVFVVGLLPQLVGHVLKPGQSGYVQKYATGMIAGTVAVIAGILYLMTR
ncbi:MAG: NADH-quinone oxidoreductase subunit L [Phycisphaerae bacterium]